MIKGNLFFSVKIALFSYSFHTTWCDGLNPVAYTLITQLFHSSSSPSPSRGVDCRVIFAPINLTPQNPFEGPAGRCKAKINFSLICFCFIVPGSLLPPHAQFGAQVAAMKWIARWMGVGGGVQSQIAETRCSCCVWRRQRCPVMSNAVVVKVSRGGLVGFFIDLVKRRDSPLSHWSGRRHLVSILVMIVYKVCYYI